MKGAVGIFVVTIILAMLLNGCRNSQVVQTSVEEEPVNVEQPNKEEVEKKAPNTEDKVIYDEDYSIRINNTDIPLHGWDDDIDLIELLGVPTTEKLTQLKNADTHTGSYTKAMTFAGFELVLFSPKHNGTTFWVMDMKITNDSYSSATGVRVGMTVSELQLIYPQIPIAPDGRTDPNNCAYEIHETDKYDYARYEVKDGFIQEIRIYSELP